MSVSPTSPRSPPSLSARSLPAGGATPPRTGRNGPHGGWKFRSGSAPKAPSQVLGIRAPEDQAMQRVLRTPRVFQSSGSGHKNRNRELRANLLPSILRTPGELAGSADNQKTPEVDGEFYRLYTEKMEQRAHEEHKISVFLEHDATLNQPETDPQQMVAATCSTFKDLVADRLSKFRRPRDGAVDTASDLPFNYPGQHVDVEELADILTLDLERCEFPFKGTGKQPGFTSFQIASRVPLIVNDPLAVGEQGKHKSQRLPNDVHVIRLDLQPGEVRHVAYSLGSPEFKSTRLASRMSALVSPEEGVLADLVRTLRSKESEVRAVTSVLNDVLRDLPTDVSGHSPHLDVYATDTESRARRLEALTSGPRKTLQRLLGALETLSSLVAPLMPSVAHALDRTSLICVREIDRLAARCHQDYEELYEKWAESEKERVQMSGLLDRMGGKGGESGGAEIRMKAVALENELAKQEQLYSNLLGEKSKQQAIAEEGARLATALRAKVRELECTVEKLRKDRHESTSVRATTPLDLQSLGRPREEGDTDVEGNRVRSYTSTRIQSRGGRVGNRGRIQSAASPSRDELLSFAVHKGVQTETEYFFCDAAPWPDELQYKPYHDVLRTAARLFYFLCRYEWNNVATKFLLMPTDHDHDDGRNAGMVKLLKTATSRSVMVVGHETAREEALGALHKLKPKVDAAVQKANESQLEEVIARLQDVANESFEQWAIKFFSLNTGVAEEYGAKEMSPKRLWETFLKVVDTHGMQKRVLELESSLNSLVPLAERQSGGAQLHGDLGVDAQFWKRVMRAAREAASPSGRRSIVFGNIFNEAADVGRAKPMNAVQTLEEIGGIWNSMLSNSAEYDSGPYGKMSRPTSLQMMQGSIRSFYLRKTGRQKLVEVAAIGLCKAVLKYASEHASIALFALMTAMQPADALSKIQPARIRDVGVEVHTDLLLNLPADASAAMASMVVGLRAVRPPPPAKPVPTMTDEEQEEDFIDETLPLSVCLDVGAVICERSQITNTYFELLLFAFTEFDPAAGFEGEAKHNDKIYQEMMFVSHILSAYVRKQRIDTEYEAEAERLQLSSLWKSISSDASSINSMRRALGLQEVATTIPIAKVVDLLVERRVVSLGKDIITRALLLTGELEPDLDNVDTDKLKIGEDVLKGLGMACRLEQKVEIRCRESTLLWVAAWALAFERAKEIELMGELFTLYDTSGDGSFQFDEFAEFIFAISPDITSAESEHIFLSAATEDGDMTKEVFLDLVLKNAIRSNVDLLEQLVSTRRAETYGHDT